MDLLLLFQFDGFSKQSDLNKALSIGSGMWFSSIIGNSIKDGYNSDKKNGESPMKKYPWFYMFIHLCFIIQMYYGFKKGMDKELRSGLFMGISALLLNCFMLHTSYNRYVSYKINTISRINGEKEERWKELKERNK